MAIRIPLPSVSPQVGSSGRYEAPRVVPQQSATGVQLANLGRAVQGVGFEASKVADFLQDQLDRAKVTEADNLTSDAIRTALHDPKTGYLNKIGRDATGDARKQHEEALNKQIESIGKTLGNDYQRSQWTARVAERRERAMAAADEHEVRQTHNYWKGVTKAAEEAARIDGDQARMLEAVDEQAKLDGVGDEVRDMMRLDANTKLWEDRIRLTVTQDPAGARAMLTKATAAHEIHPERLDDLRRLVQQSDDDEKALDLFTAIVREPTRQGMALDEQQRIAKEILDYERENKRVSADVYRKTLAQIEHHFDEAYQARQRARADMMDQVEKVFVQDPAASVESLPQPMRERIDSLGLWGDAARSAANVRAQRLAGKKVKDSTVEENKDLETIKKRIELIQNANPPEDATPEAKAAFEKQRAESLKAWEDTYNALLGLSRDAELKTTPTNPTTPAQQDTEKMLRDTLKSLREVLSK